MRYQQKCLGLFCSIPASSSSLGRKRKPCLLARRCGEQGRRRDAQLLGVCEKPVLQGKDADGRSQWASRRCNSVPNGSFTRSRSRRHSDGRAGCCQEAARKLPGRRQKGARKVRCNQGPTSPVSLMPTSMLPNQYVWLARRGRGSPTARTCTAARRAGGFRADDPLWWTSRGPMTGVGGRPGVPARMASTTGRRSRSRRGKSTEGQEGRRGERRRARRTRQAACGAADWLGRRAEGRVGLVRVFVVEGVVWLVGGGVCLERRSSRCWWSPRRDEHRASEIASRSNSSSTARRTHPHQHARLRPWLRSFSQHRRPPACCVQIAGDSQPALTLQPVLHAFLHPSKTARPPTLRACG